MVLEGTKAYRRSDGNINLFRNDRNAERFNRSAGCMGTPMVSAHDPIQAIVEPVGLEHR